MELGSKTDALNSRLYLSIAALVVIRGCAEDQVSSRFTVPQARQPREIRAVVGIILARDESHVRIEIGLNGVVFRANDQLIVTPSHSKPSRLVLSGFAGCVAL